MKAQYLKPSIEIVKLDSSAICVTSVTVTSDTINSNEDLGGNEFGRSKNFYDDEDEWDY